MRTIGLWILMPLALGAAPVVAQIPVSPAPGDVVRVTYRAESAFGPRNLRLRGTYADLSDEGLRLTLEAHDDSKLDVPLDRLVRLEVREGRSRAEGAGKGAMWGGVAGAVTGLILVGICAADDSGWFRCGGSDYFWGALTLGGIGSGAGALIGASLGTERWRAVPVVPATR